MHYHGDPNHDPKRKYKSQQEMDLVVFSESFVIPETKFFKNAFCCENVYIIYATR